jgi:uncharacterized coiled-coil protein SlyX
MAHNIVQLNAERKFDQQTIRLLSAIVKEKNSVIDRLKNTIKSTPKKSYHIKKNELVVFDFS